MPKALKIGYLQLTFGWRPMALFLFETVFPCGSERRTNVFKERSKISFNRSCSSFQYDSDAFHEPGSMPRKATNMTSVEGPNDGGEVEPSGCKAIRCEPPGQTLHKSAYAADFRLAEIERTRRQADVKPAEGVLGE